MVIIQLTCGSTLVLCIFGLLIWGGIELAHAIESLLEHTDTSSPESQRSDDVIGNNTRLSTKINDVISSFGVGRHQGFLPNIEYIEGDLDLVLAAPHGGYLTPFYLPDRDAGCYVEGKCVFRHKCQPKDFDECEAVVEHDDLSKELTFLIAYHIKKIAGRQPHLVLNNLDRIKLDPNRERHEATFDVPPAVFAFQKYHGSIEKAKKTFQGPGLVLDIHGHGHDIQRTELGYQITGDDLDRGILDPAKSSIRSLAGRVNISFEELILGPRSLGGLLVNKGYRAVPSPDETGPGGEKYFYGLYDTAVHGSLREGDVDAIMVESAQAYRQPEVIWTYAKDFAQSVVTYMQLYYNLQLPGDADSKSHQDTNHEKHEENVEKEIENVQKVHDNIPPVGVVMAEADSYVRPAKTLTVGDQANKSIPPFKAVNAQVDHTILSDGVVRNRAENGSPPAKAVSDQVDNTTLSGRTVRVQADNNTSTIKSVSVEVNNDRQPVIVVSVSDDNNDYKAHRLPVRLSLGIFLTVLAVGIIAGVWYWKANRKTRLYVSLNGGEYPLNSL